MSDLKLKQLQNETDTWKRTLAFIMDENVRLKNRLSEVLKDQFNKELLNQMEDFQSKFLIEDEQIRLLRNNITELDKLMAMVIFNNKEIIHEVNRKLKIVRKNICNAENQFSRIKSEFNGYLSENI